MQDIENKCKNCNGMGYVLGYQQVVLDCPICKPSSDAIIAASSKHEDDVADEIELSFDRAIGIAIGDKVYQASAEEIEQFFNENTTTEEAPKRRGRRKKVDE